MKYKREPRSASSKSKSSSKLDRTKIKKILKQHGISSEEARSILADSSLVSRGKHRDRRRSDIACGSSKDHERQLNGKKYTKVRIEKKKKKKKSRRSRETSPVISKMYNGYRKHTSSHSSKKKKNSGRNRKIDKPSKLIRKVMESRDGNSHLNSVDKHRNDSMKKTTKRKYDDSSSSSSDEVKYSPSKRYKYSDSLAEYLLTNYSSSSSVSEDDSEDDTERSAEPEVECTSPIVLDSDDSADENIQPNNEATRTTPIPTINDYHTRVKKVKKLRTPKVAKKIGGPSVVHPNQSNERVDSHTSDDGSSESSFESDDSSESPVSMDSKDNYVYVSKGRRRRKLRPPNLLRKSNSTNGQRVRSNERIKTKQNALKFVVTEVEPNENATNGNQTMSPEKRKSPEQRKSPVSLSPKERKEREHARRLALVKYYPQPHEYDQRYENDANESNLRSPRYAESYEDEGDWSNLSEEDYFSDFKNDETNSAVRNGDLTNYIDPGKGRKSYDLRGFTFDFNSDNDGGQVFEIEVPVSQNEYQPPSTPSPLPDHLFVEAEETVDYMEAHNENIHEYEDNCDGDNSPIDRFPIKVVEVDPNALNCLSAAEMKLNMCNREIDTASVMITESIEVNESTEEPTETTVHRNTESEGQAHKMNVNDLPTDSSSMSRDEEGEESPEAESEDDFVDEQSHGTAPLFFNSTNSRQVLMLLKTKIYFNGSLSIRLLGGQATIFGYQLEQNETVIANSPRGHSFLYLSRSTNHHEHHSNENLKYYLKELSDTFMSSDLEQILQHFNSSTDAILLLERDSSNRGIFMIEKYMKQTIFPNVNAFNDRRTYHNTESILHCQFLRHTGNGLKINPKWNEISMTSTSRQIIIGGKGVGKSTLLRYLINKNLKEFKKILLVDLDIGQPEMFLPQTVSATIITEPLLGPGYLRNQSPCKSYLFGDINVLVSPIQYLKCVLKLLKYCCSCEEFTTIPWIVNTMGYNRGFGLELIVAILRALNPTDLIQIEARRSIDNFEMIFQSEDVNKFCFNIFKDEVQDMTNDCSYSTHIYDTVSKGERKNVWNISPKDLRFAMILSKLGNILQGNDNWITDVKPICASLDDLKIIVVSDDCVDAHLQPNVLNGNLVYLCQTTEDDSTDDNIVECYGIGVVRAVEIATNRVYLLPSIPRIEMQHVNALAVCSIPLPTPIALTQSLRITGRVPYVYSSDNFIGSRQIVPITYRPDKRKFTTLN